MFFILFFYLFLSLDFHLVSLAVSDGSILTRILKPLVNASK